MSQSAKKKRRKRAAYILPAAIVLIVGGAVGSLVRVDEMPELDSPARPSGLGSGLAGGSAGHFAEPFVPCSSNILDCFSKAGFANRAGSRWSSGSLASLGARQPRGTRSRFIPGRAETPAPGFPAGIDPLDTAVSAPLTFLADEVAPFSGGGSASPAQSQRFDISPQNGGIGGIGGEVVAAPVETPTPPPTTTPPVIETPVPAIPEPATWLQMLVGFAIVGTMLRLRRGRRGAGQLS